MRSNLFVGNYVVEITVPLRNFGFGFGAALQFEFEARLPLSQLFSCQTFNSSQAFSTEARICTHVSDSKQDFGSDKLASKRDFTWANFNSKNSKGGAF